MRVLHVIPDLGRGGAERLVVDLCHALGRCYGTTVQLLTLRPLNAYQELTTGLDLVVQPAAFVPRIARPPLVSTGDLGVHLRRFAPNVVHTHLFEADLVARSVGYDGPVYLSHIHGATTQLEGRLPVSRRRLTDYYERRVIHRMYRTLGNHFVAVSADVAAYLRRILPSDLRKITVLPNAIDLDRFKTQGPPPRPAPPYRLITTGRLDRGKNHAFLLEVVRELRRRGLDVHLDLLGAGPLGSELEAQARSLGLGDCVRMHGAVSTVETLLTQAHVYVHSANVEAFGLAILEGMASGLPVVCLDAGGNRDLVRDGVTGFLLAVPNVATFADRVQGLLLDARLHGQISREAERAAQRYGLVEYASRLIALYSRLLEEAGTQGPIPSPVASRSANAG